MNLEIVAVIIALAAGAFFPWEKYPRAKYALIGLFAIAGLGRVLFK